MSPGLDAGHRPSMAGHRHRGADLLDIAGLGPEAMCRLLRQAKQWLPLVEGPAPRQSTVLQGRTILSLFNEPSTRTKISFELAARRLGAQVVEFAADARSSAVKGEASSDSLRNLDAMGLDAIVVRDRRERLPEQITEWVRARVVNAGDGRNEHPTQALLDVLTVIDAFDRPLDGPSTLRGLRVAICGDIDNGRVAHSDISAFTALGAEVRLGGPPSLLDGATAARYDLQAYRSMDEMLDDVDVLVMLRIQRERLDGTLPMTEPSYHEQWGLSVERAARLPEHAIVLHPGPMNRGVEIADAVADGPRSKIWRQVTIGVAVRMAVLARACGVEALP